MMRGDNFDTYVAKVSQKTKWIITDVQPLSRFEWVALGRTTHLTALNASEVSFIIIAEMERYMTFDLEALPALAAWIEQQKEQGKR